MVSKMKRFWFRITLTDGSTKKILIQAEDNDKAKKFLNQIVSEYFEYSIEKIHNQNDELDDDFCFAVIGDARTHFRTLEDPTDGC